MVKRRGSDSGTACPTSQNVVGHDPCLGQQAHQFSCAQRLARMGSHHGSALRAFVACLIITRLFCACMQFKFLSPFCHQNFSMVSNLLSYSCPGKCGFYKKRACDFCCHVQKTFLQQYFNHLVFPEKHLVFNCVQMYYWIYY